MAVVDSSKTSVKIYNPFALYVTPFAGEKKGETTYALKEVIKDSTSIVQDDNETESIDNEFGSAPIINNVTLGAFQFSAQVADMQQDLLNTLCGYTKGTTATDLTFAPDTYVPLYAEIALVFQLGTSKYVAAILPKVQLNSKATFESLSSNMGVITLAGSGLSIGVTDGVKTVSTPFYVDGAYELPA